MKTLIQKFSSLTLNQKLGLITLILGVLATLGGAPSGGSTATIDPQQMAMIVDQQVDHISCEELAGWIVQGKADYRLIDLRTEKEFAEYHIPSAENVIPSALLNADLNRNEKIVLYSEGGIHSAQAWFLLKAKKYGGVYILFGGLEEWKDKVLFPSLPANASPLETAAFERAKLLSKFFGGTPQTGGAEATTSAKPSMPKLAMPSSPTGPKPAGAKKKKEGC